MEILKDVPTVIAEKKVPNVYPSFNTGGAPQPVPKPSGTGLHIRDVQTIPGGSGKGLVAGILSGNGNEPPIPYHLFLAQKISTRFILPLL
jgi:hypothetical protein